MPVYFFLDLFDFGISLPFGIFLSLEVSEGIGVGFLGTLLGQNVLEFRCDQADVWRGY